MKLSYFAADLMKSGHMTPLGSGIGGARAMGKKAAE
jgi:hypothetical protein